MYRYVVLFILNVCTDFENGKLSRSEYEDLMKQFNDMYNKEVLKERALIDSKNMICM